MARRRGTRGADWRDLELCIAVEGLELSWSDKEALYRLARRVMRG